MSITLTDVVVVMRGMLIEAIENRDEPTLSDLNITFEVFAQITRDYTFSNSPADVLQMLSEMAQNALESIPEKQQLPSVDDLRKALAETKLTFTGIVLILRHQLVEYAMELTGQTLGDLKQVFYTLRDAVATAMQESDIVGGHSNQPAWRVLDSLEDSAMEALHGSIGKAPIPQEQEIKDSFHNIIE